MARHEPDVEITLSVLDRLLSLGPEPGSDPAVRRAAAVRQLKMSVRRDLEWLLNTRRTPDPLPDGLREVARSLHQFGLPDFSHMTCQSPKDQARLARLLENAITLFEPRLAAVRVVLEPSSAGRSLRFQIQGLLRMEPAPEQVTFDTLLELSSGRYEVR